MAVTASMYDHSAKLMVNKELVYTTLKAELLSASASFTAANTTRNQVNNTGAYAVSGNGWTAGGELIGSGAVTTVNTNDAKLDGSDISVTASGSDIGPASAAVVYDDTHASDAPLFYIDFGGAQTAGVGTDFKITWHANGIITFTVS